MANVKCGGMAVQGSESEANEGVCPPFHPRLVLPVFIRVHKVEVLLRLAEGATSTLG